MSKTAEEYWKAFPKHKPAKDADIAEAMREYAELYAQQRVSELADLAKRDRDKAENESESEYLKGQVAKYQGENRTLEQSNKELVEASSAQKKERLIQFMVWLHTEWAPTITIPFIPEAAERYIRINELKEVVPDNVSSVYDVESANTKLTTKNTK